MWGQRRKEEISTNGLQITQGYHCEGKLQRGLESVPQCQIMLIRVAKGQCYSQARTESWKGIFEDLCHFPFLEQLLCHRPSNCCNSCHQVFSSVLSGLEPIFSSTCLKTGAVCPIYSPWAAFCIPLCQLGDQGKLTARQLLWHLLLSRVQGDINYKQNYSKGQLRPHRVCTSRWASHQQLQINRYLVL